MRISRTRLIAEASQTGFRPEILEKVIQLTFLLRALRAHPFLKDRIVLKGGTALNLFVFNLPRLSVDIDLNYIGAADRETMLAERPQLEQVINAVCDREGFSVRRMPDEHAGGKWHLRYESDLTTGGNLQLDLNFMFRVPLWPVTILNSTAVGSYEPVMFPILDLHELAAGKLAALMARHASRDLFDAHQLLTGHQFDQDRLRLSFVVYGALNRKDWRTVSIDDIGFETRELREQLLPLLQSSFLNNFGDADQWALRLAEECCEALKMVLPFTDKEKTFLDRLLDIGEIDSSLLTEDEEIQRRIASHPGLLWKAQNVQQFRGN
jgi:predicted nucleotidyltransferase component of viral defense system